MVCLVRTVAADCAVHSVTCVSPSGCGGSPPRWLHRAECARLRTVEWLLCPGQHLLLVSLLGSSGMPIGVERSLPIAVAEPPAAPPTGVYAIDSMQHRCPCKRQLRYMLNSTTASAERVCVRTHE
jgi:hypothetical protein